MTTIALDHTRPADSRRQHQIPLRRVAGVELRKMFDTRSGFWLIASIVIAALVATVAVMLFAPDADLGYYTYAKAIGFPMTVILPIIAVLSITGEWSQRSGLTTFTLVPHRHRVILAKVVASVTVGAASMLFALAVGVVGNLVGTAVNGTEQVWDVTVAHALQIVLGGLMCLLTGTMLGLLFRSSPVALVAYFVQALLLPTLFGVLATNQPAFGDVRPWVDLNLTQGLLFEGSLTAEQWAHLGVTASVWLVLPALLALRLVSRSEVR
jgi:hypothetical protein